MKKTLLSVAAALLLASCGEVGAPDGEGVERTTGAQLVCPPDLGPTQPPPDPCAYHITRTPDATLNMSANVTEKEVEVAAPNQDTCPARVVVVNVPSTSSPNPADCAPNGCYSTVEMIAGAGSFTGGTKDADSDWVYIPKSEAACTSYIHWNRLYKKASGASSFSLLKEIKYKGFWDNGTCFVKRVCGPCASSCPTTYFPDDLIAPPKPASGTDVYRIVSNVKVHGAYVKTRVKAGYEPM